MSTPATDEFWQRLHQQMQALGRQTEDTEQILHERARRLATPLQQQQTLEQVSLLLFELSGEHYALSPYWILEVLPLRQLTHLPCTPAYILGVMAVRGRLVSVVDLRQFFNLPLHNLSERNSVILISNGVMEFGLVCDTLIATIELPVSQIHPPIAQADSREGYLLGVTPEHWAILDAEALLMDSRLVVNQQVRGKP